MKIQKIRSGLYGPGTKLPSIRQFAAEKKISKSSAVEVYERLVALELIEPRGQQGFFVRKGRTGACSTPSLEETVPPEILRRGRRTSLRHHLSGGWIDEKLLPTDALRIAMREAARAPVDTLMKYSDCQGYLPLRNLLSDRLVRSGIDVGPSEIIITDSATMAFDLICRLLLQPGDTVLVDNPTSVDFDALRRLHRIDVVDVPFCDGQRDLTRLSVLVIRHSPKLYLMTSALQNPLGTSLHNAQAFELLTILRAAGVYVVEDDVYADIIDEPVTRLAALSGLKGVAHVRSFSKTMSGGLRCGFISAEPHIIRSLAALSLDSSSGLSSLTSIIVFKLLEGGLYRRRLSGLRNTINQLRTETIQGLRDLGFDIPIEPNGGVFIWARWTGAADAAMIMNVAKRWQITLRPGTSFSPTGDFGRYIRFNCTLMRSDVVWSNLRQILIDAEVAADNIGVN